MEDPSQQVLVEENNATVLPEEKKNTNLDNAITRRPNICRTERYIQT